MQATFIKFPTREDRVRGYYAIATNLHTSSFPDELYRVPPEALSLLNQRRIAYRIATDDEVRASRDQIRNPAAVLLMDGRTRIAGPPIAII